MKRNKKVIINILLILIFSLGILGTIYYSKNNNAIGNVGKRETPPEINGSMQTPPEMDENESGTVQTPLGKPEGDNSSMPNGQKGLGNKKGPITLNMIQMVIITFCVLGFVISIFYLITSRFCKMGRKEMLATSGKKIIFVLQILVFTATLATIIILSTNKFAFSNDAFDNKGIIEQSSSTVETNSVVE